MAFVTTMKNAVGTRVIKDKRNLDNSCIEQRVGTVVSVGSPSQVAVLWDGVTYTCIENFRAEQNGAKDLLVFDPAPSADPNLKHGKICSACKNQIIGFLWKCSCCSKESNAIFCSNCFHDDLHVLRSHYDFLLFCHKDEQSPTCVQLASKYWVNGAFKGAVVERGQDWMFESQDGGKGCKGRILKIQNFSVNSDQDSAEVMWDSNHLCNHYRLGYKGYLDVRCLELVHKEIYLNCLPNLVIFDDSPIHVPADTGLGQSLRPDTKIFQSGDHVRVVCDPEMMKLAQQDINQWGKKNLDYNSIIGLTGCIENCADDQSFYVKFDGIENPVVLHSALLLKKPEFQNGQKVQIKNDIKDLQILQNGHGEWNVEVQQTAGKEGTVISVLKDWDVTVEIQGKQIKYNPECLQCIDSEDSNYKNILSSPTEDLQIEEERKVGSATLCNQNLSGEHDNKGEGKSRSCKHKEHPSGTNCAGDYHLSVQFHLGNTVEHKSIPSLESLKAQIRENKEPYIRRYVESHQDFFKDLDENESEKPCLQLAIERGDMDILRTLLVFGLKKDVVNNEGKSAFHLAASKPVNVLKTLYELGFHPNTQLFSSVGWVKCKPSKEATLLTSYPFYRVFKFLFRGDMDILRTLLVFGLKKDVVNNEGKSAFHLAASKPVNVLKTLYELGFHPNTQDKNGNIPILEFIYQRNIDGVEFLLSIDKEKKLNMVKTINNDGMTPLMLARERKEERIEQMILDHDPSLPKRKL